MLNSHADLEELIESSWRKYSTFIIFGIIAIGLMSFVGSFWYKNRLERNERVGATAFRALAPQSSMSPNIKKNTLENIVSDKKTNYRYFAALALGDIYYETEDQPDKAISIYEQTLNDKKAPQIVKNFAAQRLGYISLSENRYENIPSYIAILKKNNFALSGKMLEIFYSIAIDDNEKATQLIEEMIDSSPQYSHELNMELLNMLKSDRIQPPQPPPSPDTKNDDPAPAETATEQQN